MMSHLESIKNNSCLSFKQKEVANSLLWDFIFVIGLATIYIKW